MSILLTKEKQGWNELARFKKGRRTVIYLKELNLFVQERGLSELLFLK